MAWFVVAGLVVTMLGWRLVNKRGRDVWITIPPMLGGLGVASLLLWSRVPAPTPGASDPPTTLGALVIGALSGLLLYGATLVFVALAEHVPAFARQTALAYQRAGATDPRRELLLSLLLAVPGEELFWRGITYRVGADTLTTVAIAAVATCFLYVVANLPSRSLPIIAGALVGGALWGALAWWTGGVLAPLASHILWTGLMLARPPRVSAVEGT